MSKKTKTDDKKSIELFSEFYTKKQLLEALNICSSSLYYWIQNGDFPTPFYIAPKYPLWEKAKIHDWIQTKRNNRKSGSEE